jgi:RNA polymerase sigma-70 factor (ECF subfamily)
MTLPASLTPLSDQELVVLARAGHERADRELVRRYERPIFALIYRMVRDRELAEDLAQEAFVKALNALESYRPEFKFSSWMFKIGNNVAIDYLRKKELDTVPIEGARDALSPDAMAATAIQVPDRSESALEEIEARELGSAIEQAIGRLRPEYRSCILLRHVEDRSYGEIAQILDLPLGTVKTYIHRARTELKKALGGERE